MCFISCSTGPRVVPSRSAIRLASSRFDVPENTSGLRRRRSDRTPRRTSEMDELLAAERGKETLFAAGTVGEILAEIRSHEPRRRAVAAERKLHRVLVPGARADHHTPSLGHDVREATIRTYRSRSAGEGDHIAYRRPGGRLGSLTGPPRAPHRVPLAPARRALHTVRGWTGVLLPGAGHRRASRFSASSPA